MNLIIKAIKPKLQRRVRQIAGRPWKLAGWVVFAADGSQFESPRTQANEEGLGCAGKRKTAPQVFHTTLLHLGTNAIWSFRCGPGTDSERRHLEDMATELPEGSLVTADAGFIGYDLCRRLQERGVSFLLRVGGNVTLLAKQMDAGIRREGNLVWLWPVKHAKSPPCVLRLLRWKRGDREMFLVTNVLDPSRLIRTQAEEIYRRRWGIEVTYRTVKQMLKRSTWLSRTPSTVLAEHHGTVLEVWILQLISLRELSRQKVDPRRWSPARSRDVARRGIRHAQQAGSKNEPSWRVQLGRAVQDKYVRRRSKRARDWPHKKHDPPIKPPRLRQPPQKMPHRPKTARLHVKISWTTLGGTRHNTAAPAAPYNT